MSTAAPEFNSMTLPGGNGVPGLGTAELQGDILGEPAPGVTPPPALPQELQGGALGEPEPSVPPAPAVPPPAPEPGGVVERILARRGARVDSLTRSLAPAVVRSPDEAARYARLSAATGLDPYLLQESPEVRAAAEQEQALQGINIDSLIRTHPRTAQWLADPANADVAHDDVDTLKSIEAAWWSGGAGDYLSRSILAALPAVGQGIAGVEAGVFDLLGEALQAPGDAMGIWGIGLSGAGRGLRALGEEARRGGAAFKAFEEKIQGDPSKQAWLTRAAGQGLTSFGQLMLLSPVGKIEGAIATAFGAVSGGTAYLEAKTAGQSTPRAATYGAGMGWIEKWTEEIPMRELFSSQYGRTLLKSMAAYMYKEGGTEQVATFFQDWLTDINMHPDKTFGQFLKERPEAALSTAVGVAVGGGASFAAVHAINRAVTHGQRQNTKAFFDALSKGVADSKLHKRLPEKTREFIKTLREGGGPQDVFIDAKHFATYFQEQGMDPAAVASDLFGSPKQFNDALALGADLVIPVERYAEKLAGTQHAIGLAPDLKLSAGELSPREVDLTERNKPETQRRVERFMRQAAAAVERDASVQEVYESFYREQIAAGELPSTAAPRALLQASRYGTRAQRFPGETAMSLFTKDSPVRMRRVLANVTLGGNSLETLLDALRAQPDLATPSLKPGMDVTWRNKDTDIPVKFVELQPEKGSDGRQYAKISRDGQESFVPTDELAPPEDALQTFAKGLKALNIDLNTLTNEQVRALITEGEAAPPGTEVLLNQRTPEQQQAMNDVYSAALQALTTQPQEKDAAEPPRALFQSAQVRQQRMRSLGAAALPAEKSFLQFARDFVDDYDREAGNSDTPLPEVAMAYFRWRQPPQADRLEIRKNIDHAPEVVRNLDAVQLEQVVDELNAQRRRAHSEAFFYLLPGVNDGLYTEVEAAMMLGVLTKHYITYDANTDAARRSSFTPTSLHPLSSFSGGIASLMTEQLRAGVAPVKAYEGAIKDWATRQKDTGENPREGWVKFAQSEDLADHERLNRATATSKGNWCTGGAISTAAQHLRGGDFYVYFRDGEAAIAVRVDGTADVGEVSGSLPGQQLGPEDYPILQKFQKDHPDLDGMQNVISDAERTEWAQKSIETGVFDPRLYSITASDFGDLLELETKRANERYNDSPLINKRDAAKLAKIAAGKESSLTLDEYTKANRLVIRSARWLQGLRAVRGTVEVVLEAALPNTLEVVGGALYLSAGASAPAVTSVGGDLHLREGASAPAVTSVDGSLTLAAGASAPAVTSVGGNLYLAEKASAPAVTSVGGSLTLYAGASAPALTSVGGDLRLQEGATAPAVTSVGGGLTLAAGTTAPAVTSVSGNLTLYEGATAPAVTSVGGNVYLHVGASAPALTSVGGSLYLSEGAVAPPNLQMVGGQPYVRTLFQSATQTDTPEFRRWFGESVVTDEGGEPLVVYHGTQSGDIEAFDTQRGGVTTGNITSVWGVFFTPYLAEASRFATEPFTGRDPSATGANVVPVYLNIRKPYEMSRAEWDTHAEKVFRGMDEQQAIAEETSFRESLEEQGYDGIVIKNRQGVAEYVAFRPEQIKSAVGNRGTFDPSDLRILFQTKRGAVRLGPGFRMIELFQDENLSTILHELSHTYIEELQRDAAQPNAPQQLKDDWEVVAKELGLTDATGQIPTEAHEQWARWGEQYFREGKSPSVILREAMYKFRQWLVSIYKTAQDVTKHLGKPIPKNISGVFDRLLATDEEIDAAREQYDAFPMFSTPEDAGMTDAEWAAYGRATTADRQAATEALHQRVMAELAREDTRWWKTEQEEMRAAVVGGLEDEPVYRALREMTDRAAPAEMKLSKQALEERYGKDYLRRLSPQNLKTPSWVYAAEGGVHPDTAAARYGFSSGDELVHALLQAVPFKLAVEQETERRLFERHGNIMQDGSLPDAAAEALHTEQHEKLLAMELRILRRKQREVSPILKAAQAAQRAEQREQRALLDAPIPVAILKDMAQREIGDMRVRDIRPHTYQQAGARAGRAALEAVAKGDFATAAEEKQRQVVTHHMYREAVKARRNIDTMERRLRDMTRSPARKRIGLAGQHWLEQLDKLLADFSFAPRSTTEYAVALADFAKQVEADTGEAIAIAPALLDESRRKNYRDLTLDELTGLDETVRSIAHVAKKVTQVLATGRAYEFNTMVDTLVAQVEASITHFKPLPIIDTALTQAEKFFAMTGGAFDTNLRPEWIIQRLDGGRSGPWHDALWNPAVDAQTRQQELRELVLRPIAEFQKTLPKNWGAQQTEFVFLPGLQITVPRSFLVGAALNSGNTGNRTKLQGGGIWDGERHIPQITDAQLQEILDLLTEQEVALINTVWAAVDQLWAPLNDLNKRVVGLPLNRVEATPLSARAGELRGGYWPAVADSRHSVIGEKQENSEFMVTEVFSPKFPIAATSHSFREARTQAVYPIQLNWERVLSTHIAKATTDVAYHEFVNQARRLLKSQRVKKVLQNRAGESVHRALEEWLVHQVQPVYGGYFANAHVNRLTDRLLSNTAIAALGFKVALTAANGITAPVQALHQVTPANMLRGITRFLSNPRKQMEAVKTLSGEMRFHTDSMDQSYRMVLDSLVGNTSLRASIARTSMEIHRVMERWTSTSIWLGKYHQEVDRGKLPEDAVRLADKTIRTTQMSGFPKDLSSFERDPRFSLLKLFLGPMLVLQNEMRYEVAAASGGRGFKPRALVSPAVLATALTTWIIPAVLFELASGRGPGDDEEWWSWALIRILLAPAQMIPFVRESANAIEQLLHGRYSSARANPVSDLLSTVGATVSKTAKYAQGGDADLGDVAAAWTKATGMAVGLPTGQVVTTGRFITDVLTGEYALEGPQDVRYLFYKRETQ